MMETSVLIQVPYELEKVYSPLEERNDMLRKIGNTVAAVMRIRSNTAL